MFNTFFKTSNSSENNQNLIINPSTSSSTINNNNNTNTSLITSTNHDYNNNNNDFINNLLNLSKKVEPSVSMSTGGDYGREETCTIDFNGKKSESEINWQQSSPRHNQSNLSFMNKPTQLVQSVNIFRTSELKSKKDDEINAKNNNNNNSNGSFLKRITGNYNLYKKLPKEYFKNFKTSPTGYNRLLTDENSAGEEDENEIYNGIDNLNRSGNAKFTRLSNQDDRFISNPASRIKNYTVLNENQDEIEQLASSNNISNSKFNNNNKTESNVNIKNNRNLKSSSINNSNNSRYNNNKNLSFDEKLFSQNDDQNDEESYNSNASTSLITLRS